MAASEAKTLGYGGVSLVCRACGLSRRTITHGIREIDERLALPAGRLRRPRSWPVLPILVWLRPEIRARKVRESRRLGPRWHLRVRPISRLPAGRSGFLSFLDELGR